MTTTVTATDTAAAAKPAATTYRVNQSVVHNDTLHRVAKPRGQRVDTTCELLLANPVPATTAQAEQLEWCLECYTTQQPGVPAPEGPAATVSPWYMEAAVARLLDAEALSSSEPPAAKPKRERKPKAEPKVEPAPTPEPTPEPVRIANQPTLAAIASGKVGNYELMEAPKGVYALRGPDGKLLADNGKKAYRFESRGDAAWYAQRRTRLAQYQGFGGSARLFMPKVGRTGTWGDGRTWAITGELGKDVQANVNGKPVGPLWTHPTNGMVDAMRWLERVERKPNVA
jgi:hypothetical protein